MNTIIFLFFGIIFGYVFAVAWCKIMVKRYGVARIKGYHLHHTLFIIPAVLLAFVFQGNLSWFFLGAGIGAVVHDFFTHNKKLKFITKD